MKIFVLTKKSGPFMDLFLVQNLAIFIQKQVFGQFLQTAHQICLKLVKKLWTIAWIIKWQCCVWKNSCLGCFGHFLVKNTLHVVRDIYMVLGCFWSFSSKPLMIFCYVLLFKLSLLFKNGQWKFLFRQKFGAIFYPFMVQNLAIFAQKSGFRTFSSNPHIRFV